MLAYGRAGRDSTSSCSHVHAYHGRQLVGVSDKMRMYVSNSTSCRWVKLLHLFKDVTQPISPKHDCCENHATSCNCRVIIVVWRGMQDNHYRLVSEERRQYLRKEWHDLALEMAHTGVHRSVYCTSADEVNPDKIIPYFSQLRKCCFLLCPLLTWDMQKPYCLSSIRFLGMMNTCVMIIQCWDNLGLLRTWLFIHEDLYMLCWLIL